MRTHRETTPYAVLLGVLTFLCLLRVVGQTLVAVFDVPFLPPLHEWYSGPIPYRVALPVQTLFILIMLKIVLDFSWGRGFFVRRRPRQAILLRWFSYTYAAGMMVRYLVTMIMFPERRWFGGTIPVWFHLLLAAFLYTLSHYHLRRTPPYRPPI